MHAFWEGLQGLASIETDLPQACEAREQHPNRGWQRLPVLPFSKPHARLSGGAVALEVGGAVFIAQLSRSLGGGEGWWRRGFHLLGHALRELARDCASALYE